MRTTHIDLRAWRRAARLLAAAVAFTTVWLILCAGVCELTPSSEPITKSELYGGYEANFHAGQVDSLYLLPDSMYVRVYRSGTGQVFSDTGIWYPSISPPDSISREVFISLLDFRPRFDLDSAGSDQPIAARPAVHTPVLRWVGVTVWKRTLGKEIRISLGGLWSAAWIRYRTPSDYANPATP